MNKGRLGGQLQEYCYLAIIKPVIFKNCPKKEQGEGKADTIEYQGMILDLVRPILFIAVWLVASACVALAWSFPSMHFS